MSDLPATPTGVVAADFNGDGTTDVMSGFDSTFWGVDLALQDDYGFWTRQPVSAMSLGGSDLMAVTDANGDGAPDVVTAGQNSSSFTLLTNQGNGTFSPTVFAIPDAQITAIASATDVDTKRFVSIAYKEAGSSKVRTLVAAGGTLAPSVLPSWPENPGPAAELLLANLTGDSHVDLIVAGTDGAIRVFEGTGGATVFSGTAQTLPASPDPGPIAAMAVGNTSLALPGSPLYAMADGIPDLVAAHKHSSSIFVWRGDGDGLPAAPEAISLSATDATGGPVESDLKYIGMWIDPDAGGLLAARVGDDGFGGRLATLIVNRFAYGGFVTLGGCPSNDAVGFEAMAPAPGIPGSGAIGNSCESTNKVSIVAAQAGRMTLPAPVAFDDTFVGDSSQKPAKVNAPDYMAWGVDQAQNYGDFNTAWSIKGDDADQFSIVSAPASCGGSCPSAQIAFTPTSPGAKSAQLEIGGTYLRRTGAPLRTIELSGVARGAILDAPDSAAAGDVVTGSSHVVTVEVENTGNADFMFSDVSIDEAGDWSVGEDSNCPPELAPNQSCNLEAVFAPTANGSQAATLRIEGNQVGDDVTVGLTGRGVTGALTASPVDHGSVVVGDLSTLMVPIANEDDGTVNVASATLSGDDVDDFEITDSDCDSAIAVDATCLLTVTASPTARGVRSVTIVVASDATTSPLEIPMTVTGLQGVLTAPAGVALADTRVGFFSEKPVELKNEGDADLELGVLSADSPVKVDGACNNKTLAIDETCTATLRFEPTEAGAVASKLRVPNNGEGGEIAIDVTGTALPKEEEAKQPAQAAGGGVSVRSTRVSRSGRSVRIGLTITALDDKAIENGVLTVSLPRQLRWLPMRSRGKRGRPIRQVRIPVGKIEAGKSRNIGVRLGSSKNLRRKSFLLDATLKSNSLNDSRIIRVGRR